MGTVVKIVKIQCYKEVWQPSRVLTDQGHIKEFYTL
jgi:hypothetical protein